MTADRVIFSDGHDVIVTDSSLRVKNSLYRLKNIARHGLFVKKPVRTPGMFVVAIGMGLLAIGLFRLIPISADATMERIINLFIMWNGIVLAIAGILVCIAVKERYAVRIVTPVGKKDVVVSGHQEYISKIITALNEATLYRKVELQ